MFSRVALLLSVLILITACGATGPTFSQLEATDAEKATVYIYRPWAMLDGAASPTVQVDDVDKFDLGNGGYEVLVINPGEHKITVKAGGIMSNWRAGQMAIEYPFEANKNYYIRLSAELKNSYVVGNVLSVSGNYGFSLVREDFALQELRGTKKN